jgi:hypothetical protein
VRPNGRSLPEEEFRKFIAHLPNPYHTIALVDVCLGLRISETLALKWSDVGWMENCIRIECEIVRQPVGAVKTIESEQSMPLDPRMTALLAEWRKHSLFQQDSDWIFPSDVYIGRLPLSYPGVRKAFFLAVLPPLVPKSRFSLGVFSSTLFCNGGILHLSRLRADYWQTLGADVTGAVDPILFMADGANVLERQHNGECPR